MARPKKYFSAELAKKAERLLGKLPKGKLYIRLLAISRSTKHSIKDVAAFVGVEEHTVGRWIKLFSLYGVEGLVDKPKGHYPSKLNNEHKRHIAHWLETQKDARGNPVHWTLEKLSLEIKREFGVSISKTPLWLHLRKMGFVQKLPRPAHIKADKEMQKAFKKNC